ncbi:apolipoprotein N-acyltransferase [Winogradskyella maritima]|uniref:Apolipoprotein N-acyltransferase n=1 Tax=Winogradskyella maritima TaxID=1517766 RepID=A0ABV8AIT1_9FLAO|nr:apolipoprotein N-acyltransferase [Winogradskyella maritima]
MKRLVLALTSGLLLALSWPTYGFSLLLFFSFIPLLKVEYDIRLSDEKRKGLKVFGLSYLSFFIWNLITTNWLWFADPFGASFAILVNSLLMATVFRIYHGVAIRASQLQSLLFLMALWLSFEKLHLGWEFSWPWLNLGNAFSENIRWIQWYEYTGTFGGSLWVWTANIIGFYALLKYRQQKNLKAIRKHGIALILWFLIPIGISYIIFYTYESGTDTVEVIVTQPNIDPYSEKYDLPNTRIAQLLIDLSEPEITADTDFLLAPETVFAQGVRLPEFERSLFKMQLHQLINEHPNLNILTGVSFIDIFTDSSRVRKETNKHPNGFWYDDYNSAVLINADNNTKMYHKSKLVVGVENFPYQGVLKPLIGDAMIDLGGTVAMKTTQDERSVFLGIDTTQKAAPIICYESVYGEFVTGYVRNGANFLAIITNDAWWNETQGHKQHLSYARLRAIETRRSIARSANTGISGFINERGEITKQLGYDKQGAIKANITLNDKMTFYTIAGDYIGRIGMFVALFVFLISYFRKARV